MIIVRIVSGLGNQLFQYAMGRQLSLLTGTKLKIDIEFFRSQQLRTYKLENFNIAQDIATKDEIDEFLLRYRSQHLWAKVLRRIERRLPKEYHRKFFEREWWTYEPHVWKIRGKTYLDGYWQHRKYFESFHESIRQELTVKEELKRPYAPLFGEIYDDPHAVSIHVRRGDYVTHSETNQFMGTMPLSYYQQAVSILKKKMASPSFYVFSDDLNWVRDNLDLGGDARYMEIADGTHDFIELELMSKCKHNVIANSSFSWWGAFLNINPEKVVIAPSRWVIPDQVNQRIKLQLPGWLTL